MRKGILANLVLLGLALVNVVRCSQVTPSTTTIYGVVVDGDGPVSEAVVRVQTTDIVTITDAQGKFILTGLSGRNPVVVTAWASGYYIVSGETAYLPGQSDIKLELIPHTEVDNSDYEWVSAFAASGEDGNCENCHSNTSGNLPFDEWQMDAHSNSASNQHFLTMYTGTDVSGNQSPLTKKVFSVDYGSTPLPPDSSSPYYGPGYKLDFPETAGNCSACHAPAAAIDVPYSADPTAAVGVGAEGVACDFCHKIWDVKLDDSGLPYPNRPGVLSFEFRRPAEGHQFFAGPFDDVAPGEDTYSPLQQQSQICAPCHFAAFWDTPIYNSYGEWLDSPYSDPQNGQTCQDCHMPAGATDHFAHIDRGGLIRDPETIFSHLMPGASNEDLLQTAVSMSVDASQENGEIVLKVDIANDNTGHHVPTDSPLRHIILLVQGSDAKGIELEQLSGPTIPDWAGLGNPSQGKFAGLPGTIYAKVLQEIWTEVFPSGAYWNPTRIISDNRIPAMSVDTTTYRFAVPEKGEATIEISLLFRRAFIELAEQKGWELEDILMVRKIITIPRP